MCQTIIQREQSTSALYMYTYIYTESSNRAINTPLLQHTYMHIIHVLPANCDLSSIN